MHPCELCYDFSLPKSIFIPFWEKNGAGSFRKLVCELPDEFSKSHVRGAKFCANFPTDEEKWSLPWWNFEFCILLDITGSLTTKFLCQLFFNGKEISNVSSHDPLCLFCLVLAYVYQLTHPIFFFFFFFPHQALQGAKNKRVSVYSKYTLPSFTESLPS